MTRTRVPPEITQAIRRLCNKIYQGSVPVYVPVDPEPNFVLTECFLNIDKKIKGDAGSSQCGWAIWEWPDVLVEAEFHAVWLSPTGKMIDITPHLIECHHIMFVRDPKRTYTGKPVDSIRLPLRKDPKIDELIELMKERFEIMNRGDSPYIEDEFKERWVEVNLRIEELAQELESNPY